MGGARQWTSEVRWQKGEAGRSWWTQMANAQEPILLSTSCILYWIPQNQMGFSLSTAHARSWWRNQIVVIFPAVGPFVVLKWTLQRGKKPHAFGEFSCQLLGLGIHFCGYWLLFWSFRAPSTVILKFHLCLVLVCLIPGFRLGYTAH